jgi:hypothetical protein
VQWRIFMADLVVLIPKFGVQAVIIAAVVYILLSGEVLFRYPRRK